MTITLHLINNRKPVYIVFTLQCDVLGGMELSTVAIKNLGGINNSTSAVCLCLLREILIGRFELLSLKKSLGCRATRFSIILQYQ